MKKLTNLRREMGEFDIYWSDELMEWVIPITSAQNMLNSNYITVICKEVIKEAISEEVKAQIKNIDI